MGYIYSGLCTFVVLCFILELSVMIILRYYRSSGKNIWSAVFYLFGRTVSIF